jgi:hypothetical protein
MTYRTPRVHAEVSLPYEDRARVRPAAIRLYDRVPAEARGLRGQKGPLLYGVLTVPAAQYEDVLALLELGAAAAGVDYSVNATRRVSRDPEV